MNDVHAHNVRLAFTLGWQDVKQSYRRSPIGPFWVTLNTAILVAAMGFVFGMLFRMDYHTYLPYLAVGLIVWNFISISIAETCMLFVNSETLIKQVNLKLYVYVIRLLWKNFAIFLHNLIIIPLILLAVWRPLNVTMLLSVVGMAIVVLNLGWIVVALGIVSTRYRDFNQLTTSFLGVVFYITPVVWHRQTLEDVPWANLLVTFNPLAAMLEIVRDPIVGEIPSWTTWLVAIGVAVIGWAIALLLARRYSHRIAYWV